MNGALSQVPDWIRAPWSAGPARGGARHRRSAVPRHRRPSWPSRLCIEASRSCPNVSTLQLAFARLGLPWQDMKFSSSTARMPATGLPASEPEPRPVRAAARHPPERPPGHSHQPGQHAGPHRPHAGRPKAWPMISRWRSPNACASPRNASSAASRITRRRADAVRRPQRGAAVAHAVRARSRCCSACPTPAISSATRKKA